MEIQKIVFRRQIQMALEIKKPLVIHCREAEDDCLQILKEVSLSRDHAYTQVIVNCLQILKEVSLSRD